MDSGGGRRSGIHGGGAKETPLIDPIMLRFRPIAPKPAAGDSAAGAVQLESLARPFTRRKVKRKYVRVQKKNQCNGNNDNTNRSVPGGGGEAGSDSGGAVETLQLFSHYRGSLETDPQRVQLNTNKTLPGTSSASPDPKVVESRVTVESVGDACGGEYHAGALELDTCPSFVTDYSFSRVLWVNEAYTRLVSGGGGEASAVVAVRLVVKEELLPQWRPAFTCQVKVEHTWQNQRYSKLVPCDVWRVDYWGGFAWRLDVKTALSLGF